MIFNQKPLNSKIYEVANCFGHVKMGDFIAIMYINEALRQDYKTDVNFVISYNVMESIKTMEEYFSERFFVNPNAKNRYETLPFSGNIWAFVDYLHRFTDVRLYMKNKYKDNFKNNKVVINPLFNAPYNRDRNWSGKTFNNLIRYFLHKEYEVVVTGQEKLVEKMIQAQPPQRVRRVYDNFHSTIKEICTSEIYVGGDTGFTHLAAVTSYAPQKIVAIYGDQAEGRHKLGCRPSIGAVVNQFETNTPYGQVYADFSPKINNDKTMFYTIQKDLDLRKLTIYLGR